MKDPLDPSILLSARQKMDGLWYSKLGSENDIVHSTPEKLEENDYGKVYCIMKKDLE